MGETAWRRDNRSNTNKNLYVAADSQEQRVDAVIVSGTIKGPKRHSVLTKKFSLEKDKRSGKKQFCFIDVGYIRPHCFCYPNFGSNLENHEHFMVKSIDKWADEFTQKINIYKSVWNI